MLCSIKGFDPSLDQEPGLYEDETEHGENSDSQEVSSDDDGTDRSLLDETRFENGNDDTESYMLPPPEMKNLDAIQEMVCDAVARRQDAQMKMDRDLRDMCKHRCEQIAEQASSGDYIDRVIDLFSQCEDLENVDGLSNIFRFVKELLHLAVLNGACRRLATRHFSNPACVEGGCNKPPTLSCCSHETATLEYLHPHLLTRFHCRC